MMLFYMPVTLIVDDAVGSRLEASAGKPPPRTEAVSSESFS